MIPLLLLALGLGVAALTYELSPKAHVWLDEHVRAVRAAFAAHRVADAQLAAAGAATDSTTAVQHAHEATVANRDAAKATAEAAKTARTEAQRAAAAGSATAVVDRGEKIMAALAQLGVGQCDVRSYAGVTPEVRDALLAKLHSEGMTVMGDNPWDIDTHELAVKLRAVWDPRERALKLIVTSGKMWPLVTCERIWEKIDPIMREIIVAPVKAR